MKNVRINETGEMQNIGIIDAKTGLNWIQDFLGNNGTHTDAEGIYHMDKADYDWWINIIDIVEDNDNRITEIERELYGDDLDNFRNDLYEYVGSSDLDVEAERTRKFLNERN